jgi:hypothetical protein
MGELTVLKKDVAGLHVMDSKPGELMKLTVLPSSYRPTVLSYI